MLSKKSEESREQQNFVQSRSECINSKIIMRFEVATYNLLTIEMLMNYNAHKKATWIYV